MSINEIYKNRLEIANGVLKAAKEALRLLKEENKRETANAKQHFKDATNRYTQRIKEAQAKVDAINKLFPKKDIEKEVDKAIKEELSK